MDENSGVRRVIAVKEVAGSGGRTTVDGGASGAAGGIAHFLDLPQDDSTVGPPPGPSFDRNLPRNITMQTGKTAVLSCRVFNVNDKSVSWGSDWSGKALGRGSLGSGAYRTQRLHSGDGD